MDAELIDEARAYRRALGCFATGVAIITARAPAGVCAITVNSFTSVSLVPRLVLWCLDDRSDRYPIFADAECWSVNVLSAAQQGLSGAYARPGAVLVDPADLAADGAAEAEAPPQLRGALAHFSCRTFARQPLGDHLVLVGLVTAFSADPGDGLTYFRGRYGQALDGGG